MLLEYCDGGDLHDLIERRIAENSPFEDGEILNIIS